MSNKIKLLSSTQPVNLRLSTEAVFLPGNTESNYVYTQSVSATTWIVNHNLNKYCSVTVVDDNNDVIIGEIHYNSINQVTLTFTAAFSGKAFFN